MSSLSFTESSLLDTFVTYPPLKWNSAEMGAYLAYHQSVGQLATFYLIIWNSKKILGVIGMIIAIGLFKTVFNMNDSTILLISTISGTASFVPVAFANRSWMIYSGATVGECFLGNFYLLKNFQNKFRLIFRYFPTPRSTNGNFSCITSTGTAWGIDFHNQSINNNKFTSQFATYATSLTLLFYVSMGLTVGIINPIYIATLDWWKGFVFMLTGEIID